MNQQQLFQDTIYIDSRSIVMIWFRDTSSNHAHCDQSFVFFQIICIVSIKYIVFFKKTREKEIYRAQLQLGLNSQPFGSDLAAQPTELSQIS